ncbi:type II toxin-antitoxin system RelE/ParE family toxin [Pseudomonas granadensis]|uniref:Type II toxin-antitoxin system RelE/ParE family toxin n=1 Tax=Pseudomonas granadensis TaxID=1421430 RepID=A0ABX7GP50_9PSED|nr:type II toxin-antitoxin system RelE/ParE family toxin [Pseudomonas granadensis]
MTYELEFSEKAWKEWMKLGAVMKEQFKKKLAERLLNPHIPSARLKDLGNAYKIKLQSAGYRLVYRVSNEVLIVTVIAIGKRAGAMYMRLRLDADCNFGSLLNAPKSPTPIPFGNLIPACGSVR